MMVISLGSLIAWLAIFRGEHTILKRTTIPFAIMIIAFLGYGGIQVFVRPAHVAKVSSLYAESPKNAIDQELAKALKDDKAYSTLNPFGQF